MEFLKKKLEIDSLGKRAFFVTLSIVLNILTFVLWFGSGDEKFGIDFRGGTEIVVRFNETVTVSELRDALARGGFPDVALQSFEGNSSDFSLKVSQADSENQAKDKLHAILKGLKPTGYTVLREDFVGPVIGEKIRRDAILAIICALIVMLVYIGLRFEWQYGAGALFAIFHDVILTTGVCLMLKVEMSAAILASLLTITGYSVNDTIVIFDRIRENVTKGLKSGKKREMPDPSTKQGMIEIMNLSINQTLSRTILTSMTAFFAVTTLWMFGGGALRDMSFSLMVGVLVGTYSTIFIACPIVLFFQRFKKA